MTLIEEDFHAGKHNIHKYEEIPKGISIDFISQLSDKDMMNLNIFMIDRVGEILRLIQDSEYSIYHYVLDGQKLYSNDWNTPSV